MLKRIFIFLIIISLILPSFPSFGYQNTDDNEKNGLTGDLLKDNEQQTINFQIGERNGDWVLSDKIENPDKTITDRWAYSPNGASDNSNSEQQISPDYTIAEKAGQGQAAVIDPTIKPSITNNKAYYGSSAYETSPYTSPDSAGSQTYNDGDYTALQSDVDSKYFTTYQPTSKQTAPPPQTTNVAQKFTFDTSDYSYSTIKKITANWKGYRNDHYNVTGPAAPSPNPQKLQVYKGSNSTWDDILTTIPTSDSSNPTILKPTAVTNPAFFGKNSNNPAPWTSPDSAAIQAVDPTDYTALQSADSSYFTTSQKSGKQTTLMPSTSTNPAFYGTSTNSGTAYTSPDIAGSPPSINDYTALQSDVDSKYFTTSQYCTTGSGSGGKHVNLAQKFTFNTLGYTSVKDITVNWKGYYEDGGYGPNVAKLQVYKGNIATPVWENWQTLPTSDTAYSKNLGDGSDYFYSTSWIKFGTYGSWTQDGSDSCTVNMYANYASVDITSDIHVGWRINIAQKFTFNTSGYSDIKNVTANWKGFRIDGAGPLPTTQKLQVYKSGAWEDWETTIPTTNTAYSKDFLPPALIRFGVLLVYKQDTEARTVALNTDYASLDITYGTSTVTSKDLGDGSDYFYTYNSTHTWIRFGVYLVYTNDGNPWTVALNTNYASLDVTLAAPVVSGWAWSENIGWISFNSSNCDTDPPNGNGYGYIDIACGGDNATTPVINYGVNIDSETGYFSGYAWSENIGWIWFAPTDNPPGESETKPAKLNIYMNTISGWARACAGLDDAGDGIPNNCQGPSRTDGWDGWIKLESTNSPLYGVWLVKTAVAGEFEFHGFAWDDWLSFNRTNCDPDKDGITEGTTEEGVVNNPSFPNCPDGKTNVPDYKVKVNGILLTNEKPTAENLTRSWDYCTVGRGAGQINFGWTYKDTEGQPQTEYLLEIATDEYFSEPLAYKQTNPQTVNSGSRGNASITLSTYGASQLQWGQTYRWRISVNDGKNWSYPTPLNGISFTTPDFAYPWCAFIPKPQNPSPDQAVLFTQDADAGTSMNPPATSFCYGGSIPGEELCENKSNVIYGWDFDWVEPYNVDLSTPGGNATYSYSVLGYHSVHLTITDNNSTPAEVCSCDNVVNVVFPLPGWKEIPPF